MRRLFSRISVYNYCNEIYNSCKGNIFSTRLRNWANNYSNTIQYNIRLLGLDRTQANESLRLIHVFIQHAREECAVS